MSICVIINSGNGCFATLHWYGLGWQSSHLKHEVELLQLIEITCIALHAFNCKSCS